MSSAVIDAAGLQQLVSTLIDRGYRVVGPTLSDNAIVLAELDSADDLPRAGVSTSVPGTTGCAAATTTRCSAIRPARSRGSSSCIRRGRSCGRPTAQRTRGDPAVRVHRGAGLRPVGDRDAQRRAGQGRTSRSGFVGRLGRIFVVAVNCTEPGGLCFCASMGTGPAVGPGYDLALTERIDDDGRRYVVDVGSDDGADVLAALPHRDADQAEIDSARSDVAEAAHHMGRQMPDR